jgi:hypothetical protein
MTYETDEARRRRSEGDPIGKVTEDMRQVQDSATRTMHDLRDQAGAAVDKVKAETSELASTAGERVRGIVDQQKGVGADALGAMARAAHDAAGQLEEQTPMVARAVHQAAAGAERISRDLRDRSVGDLVNTVSDFARRERVAFFAGTVLAGLVLARFVKSSASAHESDRTGHRHQGGADRKHAGHQREDNGNGMQAGHEGGMSSPSMGSDTQDQTRMDPVARGAL